MKRQPTVVMMTTLDTTATAAQNAARRYTRHGFDSPEERQQCRTSRFFCALVLPFNGEQGRGAYARWLTFRQSVNPLLFPARPAFDSATRAIRT